MLNNKAEVKTDISSDFQAEKSNYLQKTEPKAPIAVIGPKIRFKGELAGEEDLLIQGKVEGTIDLKGHSLIIGDQGELHADSVAKTINVEGKVVGDLTGEERIAIRASSKVQGNIKAERVVLEDGAKFRGSIDMDMGDDMPNEFSMSKTPNAAKASGLDKK